MCPARALSHDALYRRCDPMAVPFETTSSAATSEDFLGQEEALRSLAFGVAMRRSGYHLFVVGPPGVGKQTLVERVLNHEARAELPTQDYCYVYNFEEPRRPRALALPAGKAARLRDDMAHIVEQLQVAVRAALESDEYRTRRQKLVRELEDRRDRAFREMERRAKELEVSIAREGDVFTVRVLAPSGVMAAAEFEQLPETERERRAEHIARAEDWLGVTLQEFSDWGRQQREALQALVRGTAAAVGAPLFANVRSAYAEHPAVLDYLSAVERDLAASVEEFIESDDVGAIEAAVGAVEAREGSSFEQRATVNVLIDHSGARGVPVVYEDHPTYTNLIGRVEHTAQFGSLIADFSLIKPGALHRARDGYLMLDAARVIELPLAWEALKRALRSECICIETAAQHVEAMPIVSLWPDPIPLARTKVVLFGDVELYATLAEHDRDFLELFRMLVEFEEHMPRSLEAEQRYAAVIARLATEDGMIQFARSAVARLIEHAARLAEDGSKLSVRVRPILDVMREAETVASLAARDLVTAEHVEVAISAQRRRAGGVRARVLEQVRDGVTLIVALGTHVGQVNGLTLVAIGEHHFGMAVRITASVWVGPGQVVDIERAVELGGPLHSKGMLIVHGFLAGRYATDRPLSVSGSIVFEQSYSTVEGDSASLAEACALLSAIAELPVGQGIAVTGSMNQHGQVQAIGGVNEKIEGFFDVCSERGLSGEQGVIIPSSNARNLMLRADVVAAVEAGKFHIYGVDTVDDALTLLMQKPAGARDASGRFPEGSINAAVDARLRHFAECRRSFALPDGGGPRERSRAAE
jgi:lon-related putative ATP-dependent protease